LFSIDNPPITSTPPQAKRRSSYEILSSMTSNGPESFLPLPVNRQAQDGIKEGVPMESMRYSPRSMSPTRTLSRIPVSSVGHARTLADDGSSGDTSTFNDTSIASISMNASLTSIAPPGPASPGSNSFRKSMGGGGTTKVLADLQTGVINARNALENTKQQLRMSQRSVAQLTRQTEDLKDGRERLRLENEGLNNVVARKERLLQEVLDRVRKAEAEAAALKLQIKNESAATKKSIRDMEAGMAEAAALSQKSERESLTLRESFRALTEGWKTELKDVREEMKRREEFWKKETDDVGLKYRSLVKLVQASKSERARVEALKAESHKADLELQDHFREELRLLSEKVEKSANDSTQADKTARMVADELARIQRLIRGGLRRSPGDVEIEQGGDSTAPP